MEKSSRPKRLIESVAKILYIRSSEINFAYKDHSSRTISLSFMFFTQVEEENVDGCSMYTKILGNQ